MIAAVRCALKYTPFFRYASFFLCELAAIVMGGPAHGLEFFQARIPAQAEPGQVLIAVNVHVADLSYNPKCCCRRTGRFLRGDDDVATSELPWLASPPGFYNFVVKPRGWQWWEWSGRRGVCARDASNIDLSDNRRRSAKVLEIIFSPIVQNGTHVGNLDDTPTGVCEENGSLDTDKCKLGQFDRILSGVGGFQSRIGGNMGYIVRLYQKSDLNERYYGQYNSKESENAGKYSRPPFGLNPEEFVVVYLCVCGGLGLFLSIGGILYFDLWSRSKKHSDNNQKGDHN